MLAGVLAVALAVSVTLLVTRDSKSAPQLTVKRVVNCRPAAVPGPECGSKGVDTVRSACREPNVAAVELTVVYAGGTGGPETFVCADYSSSSS